MFCFLKESCTFIRKFGFHLEHLSVLRKARFSHGKVIFAHESLEEYVYYLKGKLDVHR